jgi:hypothetical protein
MPELAGLVGFDLVQGGFKVDVALVDQAVELGAVFDGAEVEGLAGVEDCSVLRKVAVIRIIQAVCAGSVCYLSNTAWLPTIDEFSRQHLHSSRTLRPMS